MWSSFFNIFRKRSASFDYTPAAVPWRTSILTQTSKQLNAPTISNAIQLWPHQKAMLARCKFIEDQPVHVDTKVKYAERYTKKEMVKAGAKTALGIMNDPPGAGKTYVMLSLIAMDIAETLNVVVVPKNLIGQWVTAMRTFLDQTTVPWTVASYESVNRLYLNQNAFSKFRIVLIDETLIDTFALAYEGSLDRVIFDEVDNIAKAMTHPIATKHVWFVSASFNPDDEESITALPYSLPKEALSSVICFTDPEFMKVSIRLEDPVTDIVACGDSDIELFDGLVPDYVMIAMHAGNVRPLAKEIGYIGPLTSATPGALAEWYLLELDTRIEKLNEEIVECVAKKDDTDPILMEQLEVMLEDLHNKRKRAALTRETLAIRMVTYKPPTKPKHDVLAHTIIPRIEENPQSKWIFFNDDMNALFDMQILLKSHSIACDMLDGGTVASVQKTLDKFRQANNQTPATDTNIAPTTYTQVLLINSATEGCGLNLENATHLVFMHATKPALVQQIVGRAQRPGRCNQLHITGLFNMMELKSIENGGLKV